MAIASLRLLLARLRGNFDGVVRAGGRAPPPAVGESSADVALGNDLRAVALLNLGVTEAWSLRLADSERHLLEGADLARRIGRHYLEVSCLAHLGFASTIHTFTLARQRCEEAIATGREVRLGRRAGDRARAGGVRQRVDLDGPVRPRGTWLERARRATQADGEPGIRLLVCLTSAILQAARGRHHQALEEFGRRQASAGAHGA